MKTFVVTVTYDCTYECEFNVAAHDAEAAKETAIEWAKNGEGDFIMHDFNKPDYKVSDVTETDNAAAVATDEACNKLMYGE